MISTPKEIFHAEKKLKRRQKRTQKQKEKKKERQNNTKQNIYLRRVDVHASLPGLFSFCNQLKVNMTKMFISTEGSWIDYIDEESPYKVYLICCGKFCGFEYVPWASFHRTFLRRLPLY